MSDLLRNLDQKGWLLAKGHPVIAAIIDFYFLAIFLGFLIAVATSSAGVNPLNPTLASVIILSCSALSFLYHLFFSDRCRFVTPGEMIAGRRVLNGKVWVNVHAVNRSGIFAIAILTLALFGSIWDPIVKGEVLTFSRIGAKSLFMISIFSSLYIVGLGRIWGYLILMIYFLSNTAYIVFKRDLNDFSNMKSLYAAIVLAAIYFAAWLVHFILIRKQRKLIADNQ